MESSKNHLSAMETLENGPTGLAQPPRPTVRLSVTESEAEKAGLGDRWRLAWKKHLTAVRRKSEEESRMKTACEWLLEWRKKQKPVISRRKLAEKIGLSWASWRRCCAGCVNARRWLPKLEAAVARLCKPD